MQMNMQKTLTKKISLLLIVSILSLNFSFLTIPKRADAFLGIGDITFSFDAANFGEMLTEFATKVAEATISATAHALARQLIIKTTEATVDWINGGFDGNPAYVADFSKFLTGPGGVTDSAIGDFFANSSLNFLCNPFRVQVLLALQLDARFVKQIGCTLTGIANNVDNAIKTKNIGGSISSNTWTTWLNTTLQPQNNPIGAYVIAKNELDSQVGNAKGSATLGLTVGQGALSYTKCIDTYYDASGKQIGNPSAEYTSGYGSKPKAPAGTTRTDPNCTVKTPGTAITTMLGFKATSDQRMNELTATLSDGIDQIFGALVNSLAQRALSQLKNGVLGNNSASNSAYNSAITTGWTNSMTGYSNTLAEINNNWTNATEDIPCSTTSVTTGNAPVNYGPLNFSYQNSNTGYNYVAYDIGSSQTIQKIISGTDTYVSYIGGTNDPKVFAATANSVSPGSRDSNSGWTTFYDSGTGGTKFSGGSTINIWTDTKIYPRPTPTSYRYYKIAPGFTWNYANPTYMTFTTYDTRSTTVACPNTSFQFPTMPQIEIPDIINQTTTSTPTYWNWTPSSTSTFDISGTYGGNTVLSQAKNNANILLSSLSNSESAYENNYMIIQNILTQARAVFATSSICNINYNRNDSILRSFLIRANVITNIDGTFNSDRTIASVPWNLSAITAALADSYANMDIINRADSLVASAGSINAITDAMIPVNSTSFNTDPQSELVTNVKIWLSGVKNLYNSSICPIDLTKILQITSATSTVI